MKTITCYLRRLPVIWKLMIGATLLMFLLFATYNFAQYLVLKQWMMHQERDTLHTMMSQVQVFLKDKTDSAESLKLPETQSYMRDILGKDQMMRMIDEKGKELLLAAKNFDPAWIAPVQARSDFLEDAWHGEDHILIYRSPFALGTERGTIEIATNLETFDHFNDTLLWVMVIGGFLAVCISALSGWAIANQFLRPVKALAGAIQNVKQKGLQERVTNIKNGDEISELARLFNELMDQLETSFRQQKQFVDDASHELRTPITILEGHLNLLHRWGKNDPAVLDESLTASLQEVRRLKGLVQGLLALTRAESSQSSDHVEFIRIAPFLAQIKIRAETLYPEFTFKLSLEQQDSVVKMNPLHLEQIVFIVIENAVKYSGENKLVHIAYRTIHHEVQISVQDHGIGIPEAELPNVFNRFYRVDKARNREIEGTGLGLSIAKNLIQRYQGQISMTSVENEGTRVILTLPAVSQT
ncbi:HAMP domain-containing histidine kinase [Paenibacillus sp. VCA1]|uniref:HAMP domain-containing sensor histidine kinase n=1 Tax=Paenibacillus sp. VCA1 TaxID=3039148 RepID=UPI0028726A16|nr:HAMP domain-containing histidine kinase [Paenibacillus sp. VCA1]MDR9857117.1 HAMP domain-containing histidine kinase [Paenibacillus sp. VCA1]